MRRFDVRANGALAANGPGFCVLRLQQSLFGQHHRQRNTAEPGASVVEETASVEQVMTVKWFGQSHRACNSRRSFLPAAFVIVLIIILLLIIIDCLELFVNLRKIKNLNPRDNGCIRARQGVTQVFADWAAHGRPGEA